jgi:hypothetical protein
LSRQYPVDPGPRHDVHIEDGEVGSVVLESMLLSGPPDRSEFLFSGQAARAGNQQALEPHVPAAPSFLEQQHRRHLAPQFWIMGPREPVPQKPVAAAARVVELMPRHLVVAVVREVPGRGIEHIGPIGIDTTGVQNHESDPVADALESEAGLVAHRQESRQRIVRGVALRAAVVDPVDDQVCRGQGFEGHTVAAGHGGSLGPRQHPLAGSARRAGRSPASDPLGWPTRS